MLIELSHIQRLYRSDEVETTALQDIDLRIDAGNSSQSWGRLAAENRHF